LIRNLLQNRLFKRNDQHTHFLTITNNIPNPESLLNTTSATLASIILIPSFPPFLPMPGEIKPDKIARGNIQHENSLAFSGYCLKSSKKPGLRKDRIAP